MQTDFFPLIYRHLAKKDELLLLEKKYTIVHFNHITHVLFLSFDFFIANINAVF